MRTLLIALLMAFNDLSNESENIKHNAEARVNIEQKPYGATLK